MENTISISLEEMEKINGGGGNCYMQDTLEW